jgi:hypothetical protein
MRRHVRQDVQVVAGERSLLANVRDAIEALDVVHSSAICSRASVARQ